MTLHYLTCTISLAVCVRPHHCTELFYSPVVRHDSHPHPRWSSVIPPLPNERTVLCTVCCSGLLTASALLAALLLSPSFQSGALHYFHLEEWATVSEFQHPVGIATIYPDAAGIRVVFVDDKGDALLYNPVQDACVDLPNFPQGTKGILWDSWVSDRVGVNNMHT